MKKKEAILLELANENYEVASIAEETSTRPKRVVEIINNKILGGELEGMFDEEETQFKPGAITPLYLTRIRRANISQILGILSIVLAAVVVGMFISMMFFNRDSVLLAYAAMIIGSLTIVSTIIGTILACQVRKTKVGKVGWILNMVMVVFIALALVAFMIYLIWAIIVIGPPD